MDATDLASELVSALKHRDAVSFGKLSQLLRASECSRERTAQQLISSFSRGTTEEANFALSALGFSGLAVEAEASIALVEAAEKRFPPHVLRNLALELAVRERQGTKKQTAEVALLKSLVMVMLRKGGAREAAFVSLVEKTFCGTEVASRVLRWRGGE